MPASVEQTYSNVNSMITRLLPTELVGICFKDLGFAHKTIIK